MDTSFVEFVRKAVESEFVQNHRDAWEARRAEDERQEKESHAAAISILKSLAHVAIDAAAQWLADWLDEANVCDCECHAETAPEKATE